MEQKPKQQGMEQEIIFKDEVYLTLDPYQEVQFMKISEGWKRWDDAIKKQHGNNEVPLSPEVLSSEDKPSNTKQVEAKGQRLPGQTKLETEPENNLENWS